MTPVDAAQPDARTPTRALYPKPPNAALRSVSIACPFRKRHLSRILPLHSAHFPCPLPRNSPDGMSLLCAGGLSAPGGKRQLQVWGIEGRLYALLNRPSR